MNGLTPFEARERAIVALMPLVRTCALRVVNRVADNSLDELMSDGFVALIKAVDKFDASLGAPIEVYARQVILGAIYNGLRKRFPVSERAHRIWRQTQVQRYEIAQERGEVPTFNEMERANPRVRYARVAHHTFRHIRSLDGFDLNGLPWYELLPGTPADPGEAVVRFEDRARVRRAVAELSEREQFLLDYHYRQGWSLRDVASLFGISPQRVSQLHLRALERMRYVLAAEDQEGAA